MSRALWVLHLPEDADIKVESGAQVNQNQVLAQSEKKEFTSPINAEISEVSDEKIKLKFPTMKVTGKGYGQESVWGKLAIYDQLGLTDISCDQSGELIFVPKLSNLVLKKGAVVGVTGFLTLEMEDKPNGVSTPVLLIDQETKEKLRQFENKNCLLHASKDCLLIPKNEN